uniref:C2H2-type domain-containing protein n=1 Tax=Timema genevievae TaxID=629358 RepID=A0A7R9JRY9_TIMGE|nr:unnamed protein product [Timema genevievae]
MRLFQIVASQQQATCNEMEHIPVHFLLRRDNEIQDIPVHFLLRSDDETYGLKDITKPELTLIQSFIEHCRNHNEQEQHKCTDCGKCFARKQSFIEHCRVHSDLTPYMCKECGKGFTKFGNLRRHGLIHSGQKPYKCDMCNKSYNQASHLTYHLLSHSGLKPHQCKECDKCFVTPSKLRRHSTVHNKQNPLKCEICGECYNKTSHLLHHLLIHSGLKSHGSKEYDMNTMATKRNSNGFNRNPKKPYMCEVCEKCFVTPSKLSRHIVIYSGQKPFKFTIFIEVNQQLQLAPVNT